MHIENIKEGDYITILEEHNPQYNMFGQIRSSLIGLPIKVLAISAPFILGKVNTEKGMIDTRQFDITKLDDKLCELYFKKEEV
jgi:hypothetical protein